MPKNENADSSDDHEKPRALTVFIVPESEKDEFSRGYIEWICSQLNEPSFRHHPRQLTFPGIYED